MKKTLLFCTFIFGFALLGEARVLHTDTVIADTLKFDRELGDDYYDVDIFYTATRFYTVTQFSFCPPGLVWIPEIESCGFPVVIVFCPSCRFPVSRCICSPVVITFCSSCGFPVSRCICPDACVWCNGRDPCCHRCSPACPVCCNHDLCCWLCGNPFLRCEQCGRCDGCTCGGTGGGGGTQPPTYNCPTCRDLGCWECRPSPPCEGVRCPTCNRFKPPVTQGHNCPMCNCQPTPPTQQEIDCARLRAIAEDLFINNYIDTLIRGRMANPPNLDWEFGDMIRTVNGVHVSSPKEPHIDGFGARYTLRSGTQYTHSFHSHPYGFPPFPSYRDLWSLWQVYHYQNMQKPFEFVYGIITNNSTVILQIEDATAFNNFFYGIFNANVRNHSLARDLFRDRYHDAIRGWNPFLSTEKEINAKHLRIAQFFNSSLGLRQKVSTGPLGSSDGITRRWRIYGTDSKGNVVVIDC